MNTAVQEFRDLVTDKSLCPNRPKITLETSEYFTRILRETGQVECILRSRGIGGKKPGSRKVSCPVFRGLFHCLYKDCKIKYQIILQSPTDKFLKVSWTSDQKCHDLSTQSKRISGEKRKEIAYKICTFGVSKCIDQKLINGLHLIFF